MKSFKVLTILLFSSLLFLSSCNDASKTSKTDNSATTKTVDPATNPTTTPKAATTEPAQNASGVWHYTCRIGCPGGAGTAEKCTNCGNILAHNTAYHGNANTTSNAPFANPSTTPAPTPTTPEPAQNSAGVWHYTCTNGCAGGAGAAGTCSTCSGKLAHNTAYH
ncbi:hypothetical protein [Psychroserpens mesophilus]|uniref:hypothetical protein n=1 Tax=Psychroserpens mesophilus TaxID=325473 RepID=UPI003F4929FF